MLQSPPSSQPKKGYRTEEKASSSYAMSQTVACKVEVVSKPNPLPENAFQLASNQHITPLCSDFDTNSLSEAIESDPYSSIDPFPGI
jgi:hypothetical protein